MNSNKNTAIDNLFSSPKAIQKNNQNGEVKTTLTVLLSEKEKTKIQSLAKQFGMSKSTFAERAITYCLHTIEEDKTFAINFFFHGN